MRKKQFLLLCGIGLCAIFSSTISKSPALPLFSSYLGASPSVVGLIAAISAFTGVIFSIPAGILADKFGKKTMLIFSAFVFSTAPFLYIFVKELWRLAIIRFYHGLATAIFMPVAIAMVSEIFPQDKGEKMGWFSTATLLGRFIAPVIGGSLISILAFNPRMGFKTVYLVCGLSGIMTLAVLKIPVSNGTKKEKQKPRDILNSFKTTISDKKILITSLTQAAILFAYGAFETFLPLYAIKIGLSVHLIGILLAAQIITVAFSKPIMGRFSDRHGRKPQIFMGLLLSAACMGGLSFFTSFLPLLSLSILFGLSHSVVTSAVFPFIADLSQQGHQSSAMGVLGSIMDIGHTTGPLVSGMVAAYMGLSKSFVSASSVLLIAAISFYYLVCQEKKMYINRGLL